MECIIGTEDTEQVTFGLQLHENNPIFSSSSNEQT
jgi:hypothetical protein